MNLTACAAGLVMWGLGCASDARISLAEFIDLQNQYEQGAGAEEQPPPPSPDVIDLGWKPYQVGIGDTLVVTSSGIESAVVPSVTAMVDRDGEIDLPLVGKIQVAGMELEDAEDAVKAAYVPSRVRDLAVHVEVSSYDTTDVTVVGAVVTPGVVPLLHHQRNLLFAILAAGGVSQSSSGRVKLQRLRRPQEDVELSLLDPAELQEALALDPLENGDIVTVEAAAANTIFVGGLVNGPAPQSYPLGTHVNILQAVASAGGLRTDVTPRVGTLIRRMPDGKDVRVKLNLARIARGEDQNIMLAAGDILWVPHTWETRVQDFINRNFFLRAGFSANVSYNVSGTEYLNRQRLQASRFSGGQGGAQNLQTTFDPFGFLSRNAALQNLQP